ncbi:MAG: sel1 repeat family protein [Parvularculaceae bacterium]
MPAAIYAAETQAEASLSAEDMYRMGLAASTINDTGAIDLVTAHMWFNLAAMRGNIEARAYRAELSKEMAPEEVAEAQRLAREYLSTHTPRRAS